MSAITHFLTDVAIIEFKKCHPLGNLVFFTWTFMLGKATGNNCINLLDPATERTRERRG